MSDVLKKILARKKEEIAEARRKHSAKSLEKTLASASPSRGFASALRGRVNRGRYGIIAEIKKASPSKGLIRADFDPAALAADYESGGATCLSVLTDRDFFQGAPEFLVAARAACRIPVLRKDFMIDPYQILESRMMGADCILLIVAALRSATMQRLATQSVTLGMDVLVEVHNLRELERALKLEIPRDRMILGINNRNLRTFETTLDTTVGLVKQIPSGYLVVSESGIFTRKDMAKLDAAGVHTFLIGESLMRQPSPGAGLKTLLSKH